MLVWDIYYGYETKFVEKAARNYVYDPVIMFRNMISQLEILDKHKWVLKKLSLIMFKSNKISSCVDSYKISSNRIYTVKALYLKLI